MIAIVYASRTTADDMPEDELRTLLDVARTRNEADAVTGMLLHTHGSFLQLIEGEPAAVDGLYDRIARDPRHREIRVLGREPITTRTFGGWWMGFEHPSEDELASVFPAFKPATTYPLVNPDLVHNAVVARTLLKLYARNP